MQTQSRKRRGRSSLLGVQPKRKCISLEQNFPITELHHLDRSGPGTANLGRPGNSQRIRRREKYLRIQREFFVANLERARLDRFAERIEIRRSVGPVVKKGVAVVGGLRDAARSRTQEEHGSYGSDNGGQSVARRDPHKSPSEPIYFEC